MKKVLILLGLVSAVALLAQVARFPQGGTGSPGPFATGSRICSDGNKFVTCPPTATSTPTDTPTNTPTNTPTATPTSTTPTNTPTVTPTNTPTPTPTNTPVSSSTLDETLWQKSFFVANSLLPTTNFKDSVSSWPACGSTAADTGHVWSSDLAWEKDTTTSAATNSGAGCQWDIGSAQTVVLFVIGGMGSGALGTADQVSMFAAGTTMKTTSISGQSKNGYEFMYEGNQNRFSIYKTDASTNPVYTLVSNFAGMAPPQHSDSYPLAAALRVDGSAHTVMGFIRSAGQWIRVLNSSDSTNTSFRYVGIRTSNGNTSNAQHWFAAPVEIWYSP